MEDFYKSHCTNDPLLELIFNPNIKYLQAKSNNLLVKLTWRSDSPLILFSHSQKKKKKQTNLDSSTIQYTNLSQKWLTKGLDLNMKKSVFESDLLYKLVNGLDQSYDLHKEYNVCSTIFYFILVSRLGFFPNLITRLTRFFPPEFGTVAL